MGSNQDIRNLDTIFQRVHKDLDLFIYLKNFVKDANNTKKATEKVINDYANLKQGDKKLSKYYSEIIERDPQNAIKLMGRYLAFCEKLNQLDLDPIRNFLKSEVALEVLYKNCDIFANLVVPEIWKLNLFNEFDEMGLDIRLLEADCLGISPKLSIKLNNYMEIFVSINLEVYNNLEEILDSNYSIDPVPSYPIFRDYDNSIQYLEKELEAL